MKLQNLKGKTILILGLGQEGESTYFFLRELFPDKTLGLADKQTIEKLPPALKEHLEKDQNIKLHLGSRYLESLKNYEVIIKSPGVSPYLPEIEKIPKEKITSATEIFFDNCPGVIIGITGTKGKSTTASLVYEILKGGGLPVQLIGNIGKPALSFLEKAQRETIFVYELSSHQLLQLKKSPHVAVFLNIYPEHLDYYPGFDDYLFAKENITRYQNQNDYFIFNAAQPTLFSIASKTKAQKLPYSLENNDNQQACFVKNEALYCKQGGNEEKIINISQIPLLGRFNLQNVMPAIIIGKIFKLTNSQIATAITSFKPLEHRLEKVGTYQKITFYNDSIATVPEATIAAIEALGNKIGSLILGGHERQQNFNNLAKKILESSIGNLILFPTTGERIWQSVKKQKPKTLPDHFFVDSMEEAVKIAHQNTQKGKICLLSPSSPSFGLFKNYKERGELFKKFVKAV